MFMMILNGSEERSLDDWKRLFTAADPRLKLTKCITSSESVHSIMEIVLDQEEKSQVDAESK